MTFTPIDRWAGMPEDFDRRAADAVYGEIIKMDADTAEVLADMLIGEAYQYDLLNHGDVVSKAVRLHMDVHGDAIRASLTRSFIGKRQAGEPVDDVVAAAEAISKALGDDQYNRDSHGHFASIESRAAKARQHALTESGKLLDGDYVRSHHPIGYSVRNADGKMRKPLSDSQARALGIPTNTTLKGAALIRYQQAYQQVGAIVNNYASIDTGNHFIHLSYPKGEEVHSVADFEAGNVPLAPGLRAVSVSRLPDADHSPSAYDTLQALGGNYGYGDGNPEHNVGVQRIRTLDAGLHQRDHLDRAGTKVMRRLGASSQFLDESFQGPNGSVLPRKVQAALKAGQVVGMYGPEAQNVIGPAADRAAYRYRGTERAPDRRLTTALENTQRAVMQRGSKDPADAREIAIHGIETDNGWRPSGVLNYFRSRLPNADLNTLQRKSGTIPPSEGVIFDKSGKVVTQASGYGDDHYLPFNLKNLKPLRGGEYVRTRTWGGPTTEDVYTGLISGAKSLTVVSHNGVYNIEFDDQFKGSRRYNDKAARMVARYGQLLDAVKNGQITTGMIDPAKMDELAAAAESQYDPDTEPREWQAEFDRLRAKEMRNPTLSAGQRAMSTQAFLDQEALRHKTPDGHEMTREEFVDSWLTGEAHRELAGRRGRLDADGRIEGTYKESAQPKDTIDDLKADIALTNGLRVADPAQFNANAVRAMGLTEKHDRYLEREEKTYRASLKPLELNGPGYDMALQALQEQFPYYIKSTSFHPWSDARNMRDTGYVKPKHNRPADVLSGYFDEDLGGKVRAHTTRGQGQHEAPKPYKSRSQRVEEAARASKDRVTDSVTRGSSLTADDARELTRGVDLDLIRHIQGQTLFSREINGGDGLEGLGGEPASAGTSYDRKKLGALGEILDTPIAELERMQATPGGADRLHKLLGDAVRFNDEHKAFRLDNDRVQAHLDGGRPPKIERFDPSQTNDNLRNFDKDRDFGQAVLHEGREMDPENVLRAYNTDAKVKDVGLPALNDSHFDTAFDAKAQEVKARQDARIKWRTRGGPRPEGMNDIDKLVEGLHRAKQYQRRYNEALAAQKPADEPVAAGGFGFMQGGRFQPVDLSVQGPSASSGGTFTALGDQGDGDFLNRHGISL